MVGALGGLGGFLLPNLLGSVKQTSDSFAPGFLALAGVAFGALALLRLLAVTRREWRHSWALPKASAETERISVRSAD
ncbi:MAG: hypothetical protein EXR47_06685 [Dehalococcoidia bacterium]|nr:hypothetical protein [Dehalococcoidia bacterium]